MRRIAEKHVPRLISNVQKEYGIAVCTELKEQAENDSHFISNIITGDEFRYDHETEQQSSQLKTTTSPRPKKAQFQSNVKLMLICCLEIEGIVQKEFVPPGQAANGKLCCEVLRRLRENIRRKRPDRWRNNSWALHHYNARARASLVVRQFLASTNTTVILHPPYSLDLTPCNFFFPNPEDEIEAQRATFDSIEEIQTESQDVMTLTRNDYQQCFRSWKSR